MIPSRVRFLDDLTGETGRGPANVASYLDGIVRRGLGDLRMAAMRDAIPNNLPVPLTTFVGRDREIAEVLRLLAGTRLLTLAGAGGCGKSRLGVEVAKRAIRDFPDGLWVVELAALSDANLVPQSVAAVLGLAEQPGRHMIGTLVDHIRSSTALLVLDNCEHLLAGCAETADALLRAAPRLRILATSREPLRLPGETIWRVPSLAVPEPSESLIPGNLARYEAVRLFVERAASVRPGFRLTEANAAAIAQICTRLDGMPLAIEIAAVRVKALTVQQIAGRLDDRLRLLTGGSRTLPRHRTLRAAMDWSYDLLTERERTLLARLSVFRGSWTLDAAEAVCAGNDLEAADVLDGLTSLVDKSLVIVDTRGTEARYRLLETTWQFARERLLDSDNSAVMQRRHRDWYLDLAVRAARSLVGAEQDAWLDRLALEHDNFRAALAWTRAEPDGTDTVLRLVTTLERFWIVRGHWSEARVWLEEAVSRTGDALTPALPRALELMAYLAERQGDDRQATALAERCRAVSTALGDRYGIADALLRLGNAALNREDYDDATTLCEESLALYREFDAIKDVALVLAILGDIARGRGDFARAGTAYRESLETSTRAGDRTRVAYAQRGLAAVAWAQGDNEQAATLWARALSLSRELGFLMVTSHSLEGLAGVAAARGDTERAARLLGAAAALRETLGLRLLPPDRVAHTGRIDTVRAACGEKRFDDAVAAGRAMTLEAVTDYALRSKPAETPVAESRRRGIDGGAAALTPRQREIAGLVAQGLANRDIAARLVIAERTAEGHVQSILNKLGFNSRAQIAAWAVTHGVHAISVK